MTKSNIVLIGMPGVGKSSVGVVLAKKLGMDFVDTDLVIIRETGQKLSELIAGRGTEGFLALENRVLSELRTENAVIATGGSAVYGEDGMRALRERGTVVYLAISCEALARRLGDLDARGVVHAPGQSLRDIYEERRPLYERYADVTVTERGTHLKISATLAEIEKELASLRDAAGE